MALQKKGKRPLVLLEPSDSSSRPQKTAQKRKKTQNDTSDADDDTKTKAKQKKTEQGKQKATKPTDGHSEDTGGKNEGDEEKKKKKKTSGLKGEKVLHNRVSRPLMLTK